MKKIILILFSAVLLIGCGANKEYQKSTDNNVYQISDGFVFKDLNDWKKERVVSISFFGFSTIADKDGNVVVKKVIDKLLQSILAPNDMLVNLNSTQITSRAQYFYLVHATPAGTPCDLTFKRSSGDTYSIKIVTGKTEYSSSLSLKLSTLLDLGNTVSIAVLVSAEGLEEKDTVLTFYEKTFLTAFGNYKNFSVVDRVSIDKILTEQQLSLSGAVDEKAVLQVGKIAGATHLLVVACHRSSNELKITERLLDLVSGKVLTSDNYKMGKN
jgi:TolB-like protein